MKEIGKNEYYEIKVDNAKNRLYFKVIGFWQSPDVVPNYVEDIGKGAKELSRGFTVLADLREMKTPPLDINPLHEQAQNVLVQAGLDRTAELLSDVLLKSVTKKYADKSQMKKQVFSSYEEAEKWLDS